MSQLLVGTDPTSLEWLGGILTAVFLICFCGWTWWAYAPANRVRHDAAARLPLEGEEQ